MDGANDKKVRPKVNWTLKLYIKLGIHFWKTACFVKVVA